MIARIEGVLGSIEDGAALVTPTYSSLTYQVLLPAFAAGRLGDSIGQTITLSTLYFLESQGQGATMIPRLAGFLTVLDKQFFELFTTCKGIGNRKALRSMALDIGQMAAAIADRDVAMLQSLPEIGRRTAETIVATLHGKVDRFISTAALDRSQAADPLSSRGQEHAGHLSVARQAMDVLLQLGENRAQALNWIEQVTSGDVEQPDDVQELIAAVYRLKARG